MFGYALRHPKVPASNGIINKAGLTPLTLACQLGTTKFLYAFNIRYYEPGKLKCATLVWLG